MYPQQPQYPVQPAYPQAPPQYPTYPQQPQQPAAYPQYPVQPQYPVAPAAPPAPPAAGTLDAFYNQPGGGAGKAFSFHGKPVGTSYGGIVARPITNGDIQQQTDLNDKSKLRYFKDGRPMFVMVVPMLVQPSPEFPEGQAAWYVRGQARDELVRAMSEAGAPEGPPEAGAAISVTLVGHRPSGAGLNPAHQYRIQYQRPAGAPPVAPPVQAAPPVQPTPQPVVPAAGYAVGDQTMVGSIQFPVPQQSIQPVQPVPAQAAPQSQMPPQVAASMTPEQQALLAKLTGG